MITIKKEIYPAPIKVNIGPGQAPARAQPIPKIMPPNMYLGILMSFGLNIISCP
jgi:hypothetical protein